jgi:hypothetical protein
MRIVCILTENELSVSELAHQARMAGPALSQRGAILEAKALAK